MRFTWSEKKCECQCCCDDLRRLHWGIDYCRSALAQHLPKAEIAETPTKSECPGEDSMVTCMCVTHNRVALLRRSINAFSTKLIPIGSWWLSTSRTTKQRDSFLPNSEKSIHPLEVPAVPRLTLGSLRNIALQAGTGKYVAQWDDDDWYSPERLAEQMRAIRETGKQGCLLSRLTSMTA